MDTNTTAVKTSISKDVESVKEVSNQQLLTKLLELEKMIEKIEKHLITPLIN